MGANLERNSATRFPENKHFAFTIMDDTDDSTVQNTRPIYDLLSDLNFRTTKTVWPLDCPEGSGIFFAGQTLANSDYLAYCHELQSRGFELTWHGATMESSDRARTIKGLRTFNELLGHYPQVHANHGQNRENIYWGHKRYRTPGLRLLARFLIPNARYSGEIIGSRYFWGDLCSGYFRFVRNFTFYEINTFRNDPFMPYRLKGTPFVNYWFSGSDAPDVHHFIRLVTRASVDRLCEEGGVCILCTHLGKGFVRDGKVDAHVADTLRYLASLPGWFVPVSDLLEHLLAGTPDRDLSPTALGRLEFAHALDRLRGHR